MPAARIASRGAVAVLWIAALGDRLAFFTVTLPYAASSVVAKPEMRHIELRDWDTNKIATLAADHLAVRDVFAKILPDPAAYDLSEAALIPLDFHDHGWWNDEFPNDLISFVIRSFVIAHLLSFASPRANMLAT